MSEAAIRVYTAHADALAECWNKTSLDEVFKPVADVLPQAACRIGDIGAGPGRVSAWLAQAGHEVVAVEPVQAFRDMAQTHDSPVTWLSDSLPHLTELRALPVFDLLLLIAVWHHVRPEDRAQSFKALATCLRPGGQVLMSLRHGAADIEKGLFHVEPDETVSLATEAGLKTVTIRHSESVQIHNRANGVHWTWLLLERDGRA